MSIVRIPVAGTILHPLDDSPAVGTVTFINPYALTNATGHVLYTAQRVPCPLDSNGAFTISLPATDDPAITPQGWSYSVLIETDALVQVVAFQVPAATSGTLQFVPQVSTVFTVPSYYVPLGELAQPGGVATLDGTGSVPLSQLGNAGVGSSLLKVNYPVVNLRAAGATGAGIVDDAPAIQAVVTAAASGSVLYLPQGSYLLRSGIKWKSGLSLVGDGPGKSILKPYNAGPLASGFSAIYNTTDGSAGLPLTGCRFQDFEIDGSGITTTSYDVGSKGINILYMLRPMFANLYIHDCLATGLGCDQLAYGVIRDCVVTGNGRQNSGTQPGGAGIGIGTGGYAQMPLVIEGCTATGNGTHGIFLEHQYSGTPTLSQGVRIVGCHASGNRHGISDWGVDGLVVEGCWMQGNLSDGFNVSGSGVSGLAGTGGVVSGCVIDSNYANGVTIGDSAIGRYTLTGNRISGNAAYGVQYQNVVQPGTTALLEMSVIDNDIWLNALSGVRVDAPITDSHVSYNRIRNNGIQSAGSDSGTSTTVTATALTDTTKAWLLNAHAGKTVTAGAVTALVISNTATVLTLGALRNGSAWSGSAPSSGATYTLPAASGNRHGIDLNAGTSHLLVRGNRIHDNLNNSTVYGSARRQLYGINCSATGSLSACQVENNDVLGNLTGTFAFTTAPSGGFYVRWNNNYNPRGIITAPTVPATSVATANSYGADATVFITGGTVTSILVNSTTTGLTSGAIPLGPNASITINYSAAPTWQWYIT